MLWGLPYRVWELWCVLVLAMVLVAWAVWTWGPDGRQPPAELPRRPLPPAPRVPKHAQWTRPDGEIGGQTTRLGWHTPDRARAGVFPTVPLTRPTGHEDEQVMGPWPGDRP
jgi:hypothetical protein